MEPSVRTTWMYFGNNGPCGVRLPADAKMMPVSPGDFSFIQGSYHVTEDTGLVPADLVACLNIKKFSTQARYSQKLL
jgi:hypothetical protein